MMGETPIILHCWIQAIIHNLFAHHFISLLFCLLILLVIKHWVRVVWLHYYVIIIIREREKLNASEI